MREKVRFSTDDVTKLFAFIDGDNIAPLFACLLSFMLLPHHFILIFTASHNTWRQYSVLKKSMISTDIDSQ